MNSNELIGIQRDIPGEFHRVCDLYWKSIIHKEQ